MIRIMGGWWRVKKKEEERDWNDAIRSHGLPLINNFDRFLFYFHNDSFVVAVVVVVVVVVVLLPAVVSGERQKKANQFGERALASWRKLILSPLIGRWAGDWVGFSGHLVGLVFSTVVISFLRV